jgi:F-type H+-transporting ATPase subunit b
MNAIFLATNLSDTVRETGEAFGWDPKLFFSQVISFIIVAYLLKRFAYKPILGVLEQRRQQIAQAASRRDSGESQCRSAEDD